MPPSDSSAATPYRASIAASSTRLSLACAPLFVAVFVLLSLGGSRQVGVYDEGFVLTAAMRVLAGQVPHRDFYYAYGPAQPYMLALLMKLFGPSLLAARLLDNAWKAAVVVTMFVLASRFCRTPIALACALICTAWYFSFPGIGQSAPIAVSLFALLAAPLLLGRPGQFPPARWLLAAGLLDGAAFAFRYEIALGILAAHFAFLLLPMNYPRYTLRAVLRSLAILLGGFAILALPLLTAFALAGANADLFYDLVQYPARYYRAGRSLPFPHIHASNFMEVAVYLPILVLSVSAALAVLFRRVLFAARPSPSKRDWISFTAACSFLALIMFFKGVIRVSVGQSYLALVPSLLIAAVLLENRSSLPRLLRCAVFAIAILFVLTALTATRRKLFLLRRDRSSVLEAVLHPPRDAWCASHNPLTRGVCFLDTPANMRAIAFLRAHTSPADTLYVGVPHHDLVFASNSMQYFATGLLPATRWAQFDPDLQNRADIQAQMIADLDRAHPPYIALDAEFDDAREPNDSAKHSGVVALDRYLESHYTPVASFGPMSLFVASHSKP